jgi:hypothetical protein
MSLCRYDITVMDNVPRLVPGASIYAYVQPTTPSPITPTNWLTTLGGLAPLYADSGGVTPITNPFNVDSNGSGFFYAAGGLYTVVATGGTLAAPVVYIDQSLVTAAASGAVNEVNGVPLATQTVLNLVQGANITLSASGGNVTLNASAAPITFKVNGTSASSQVLQNLAAGAGITLTDSGVGTITFASTGALSLEVNGADNVSQALLNLIAGSNITLADNGVGGVTITAVQPAFQYNGTALTAQTPINFVNGTGISVANPSAGQVQFNLTGAPLVFGTPTSALTPGIAGQTMFDLLNFYVCTVGGVAGAATWTKAALVAV